MVYRKPIVPRYFIYHIGCQRLVKRSERCVCVVAYVSAVSWTYWEAWVCEELGLRSRPTRFRAYAIILRRVRQLKLSPMSPYIKPDLAHCQYRRSDVINTNRLYSERARPKVENSGREENQCSVGIVVIRYIKFCISLYNSVCSWYNNPLNPISIRYMSTFYLPVHLFLLFISSSPLLIHSVILSSSSSFSLLMTYFWCKNI